ERSGPARASEIVADPHANAIPAGVLVTEDPVAAHLGLVVRADTDRPDLAQRRYRDPPALAAEMDVRAQEEGGVLLISGGQREARELVVVPELEATPPAREEAVEAPQVVCGHLRLFDGAVGGLAAARRDEIGALLVLELDPRVGGPDQPIVEEILLEYQPELERHRAGPDLGLDVEGQTDRILVRAQEAVDPLDGDPVEAHRAVLLGRVVIGRDVDALGEMGDAVVLRVEVAVVEVARELEVVGQAVFYLGAELEVVIVAEGLALAVGDPLLELPFPFGQELGRVGVAEERLVGRYRHHPDQTREHERQRAQGAGGDRLERFAHGQPSFPVRRGTGSLAGCRPSRRPIGWLSVLRRGTRSGSADRQPRAACAGTRGS